MSEIALYNVLRRIDGVTDDEIEKAVADIANTKNVATKADVAELKAELKAEMYKLNNRTIMWMVGIGLAIIGVIKYL